MNSDCGMPMTYLAVAQGLGAAYVAPLEALTY